MALPPPKAGKKPAPGASTKPPAGPPPDVGLPPDVPGAPDPDEAGMPPGMMGADEGPMGGGMMGGGPTGPPGPPQFPSADPNAILGLLMQLDAHDQQALGAAQVQAVGQAFSQLMQSQPDPQAQAAQSGPPPVTGPPQGAAVGSGY